VLWSAAIGALGTRSAAFTIAVVTAVVQGCASRTPATASPGEPAAAALWIGGDVHLELPRPGAFAAITGRLPGAAGIINLEGPLDDGPLPPRPPLRLANRAAALATLIEGGVRVAGIANNHALDTGPDAPARTARALAAAGVAPAGPDAAVVVLAGQRVAVTAHDLGAGLPPGLAEELARARGRGDRLIATFHVTGPPSYLPGPVLREAAALAARAGADIVAAHGSHALGPVARLDGAVVAWGLGNLLFACDCTDETEALLLEVRFPRAGPPTVCVLPVHAGLGGAPARLAADAGGIFDLLAALGSAPLRREGDRACL
jgi:hypothetical protein